MISVLYGHLISTTFVQAQNRPFSFVQVEISESGDFGQVESMIMLSALRTKFHEIFDCMMRWSPKISKRSSGALTRSRDAAVRF